MCTSVCTRVCVFMRLCVCSWAWGCAHACGRVEGGAHTGVSRQSACAHACAVPVGLLHASAACACSVHTGNKCVCTREPGVCVCRTCVVGCLHTSAACARRAWGVCRCGTRVCTVWGGWRCGTRVHRRCRWGAVHTREQAAHACTECVGVHVGACSACAHACVPRPGMRVCAQA